MVNYRVVFKSIEYKQVRLDICLSNVRLGHFRLLISLRVNCQNFNLSRFLRKTNCFFFIQPSANCQANNTF